MRSTLMHAEAGDRARSASARPRAGLVLAALLLATTSCERGCLSTWLADKGVGAPKENLLARTDCPPGLARCLDGKVQLSQGEAVCPTCACPWRTAVTCAAGCAAEGVVVVRDADRARGLCKSGPGESFFRSPPADAPAVRCDGHGERFVCRGGVVGACPGTEGVPVANCAYGCVSEGETLDDPAVDLGAATAMLCKRSP